MKGGERMKKLMLIVCLMLALGVGNLALAGTTDVDVYPDSVANINLGNASPEELVVSVINWILGLLALVAVIMILIGGFMWMTAGGNEEKVEKAKKLLIAAIIGLVIILAAWGISVYVITNLLTFTT
ncbi:MAG: pilin [Patescibacteria group bacterium]